MTSATPINTKKVTGRRTVRYESFNDILADAERLAGLETNELGNWSKGQIYKHLAASLDAMLDGPPFLMPAPIRWLLCLLMKNRMLTRTLDPGFQLPKSASAMLPGETTTSEGLELLRAAVQRVNQTDARAVHGGFGKIPPAEWDQFQFRHCEMHMSFIVPSTS